MPCWRCVLLALGLIATAHAQSDPAMPVAVPSPETSLREGWLLLLNEALREHCEARKR